MKRITLVLFALINVFSAIAEDGTPRIVKTLNFGWKFCAGDMKGAENTAFDDSKWQEINVPHDFQIEQPWVAPIDGEKADFGDAASNVKSRLSSRAFKEMGVGWYRKAITPDDSWRGKRILLDFEGIMLVGDVYLNGEHIGKTDYGYVGFDIDISKLIKFGEENVIAVKANTMNPENSRWYTGGGLFRDVNLIVTDAQQYFNRHSLYIRTENINESTATINIQAEMTCNLKIESLRVNTKIIDADGNVVYDKTHDMPFNRKMKTYEHPIGNITLKSPKLWSCESPYLYKAVVSFLRPDGTVADKVCENFGIRTIEYSPAFGFKLNGKKVLMKGVANHHTLGALGAAAYPRAIEKRIQLLKDFGFNHIRTSHNPYSKSLLDLCDKYGILVVDELYDKWLTKFAGGREEWTNLWQKDVPEFIRRDRNHPSVVMWSLGNELQTYWELPYADWGVTAFRLQRELLHRYDKTRPVTVAMHPRGRSLETDSLPAPLVHETDIAAYNYRYMYFPGDGQRFPNLIFYQSEANTSNMGPNYFEMDLDKVVGLAYWGMIDYLGESNGWPAKGWTQGVFDISLEPKPLSYFIRSYFKPEEPIVHIGIIDDKGNTTIWNDEKMVSQRITDHWNRKPESSMSLYTYTNADEVELFVNGKSIGKRVNDKSNPKVRNRIKWDNVRYEAGYIEAVARINGRIAARHKIETVNDAKALKATADNADWSADGMDLQHIRVEAVDNKGRRVQLAENMITFTVEGPADIVGVINGDMTSDEMTVGNTRSLYNGTASVILRSKRQSGKVTLTATTNGLKAARIILETK